MLSTHQLHCKLHLRFPGELHERLLRVVADGAEDLAVKHARREADARAAVDEDAVAAELEGRAPVPADAAGVGVNFAATVVVEENRREDREVVAVGRGRLERRGPAVEQPVRLGLERAAE